MVLPPGISDLATSDLAPSAPITNLDFNSISFLDFLSLKKTETISFSAILSILKKVPVKRFAPLLLALFLRNSSKFSLSTIPT